MLDFITCRQVIRQPKGPDGSRGFSPRKPPETGLSQACQTGQTSLTSNSSPIGGKKSVGGASQ